MSSAQFARRFALLAFGFCWGAVMAYSGLFLTGRGHGTYIPFSLATSPLSLGPLFVGNRNMFWSVVFAVPLWWTLMVSIAGSTRLFRILWCVLISAHYAGAALLIYRTDFAFGVNGRAFRGSLHIHPAWTIGALLVYCIGQSIMWYEFTTPLPESSRQAPSRVSQGTAAATTPAPLIDSSVAPPLAAPVAPIAPVETSSSPNSETPTLPDTDKPLPS